MKSLTRDPESLLALARRGELPAADERALAAAVQGSAQLQALREAGVAFDRIASVAPGDEELVRRLAVAVRMPRARTRHVRWPVAVLSAAAVLAAGGAFAVTGGHPVAYVSAWAVFRSAPRQESRGVAPNHGKAPASHTASVPTSGETPRLPEPVPSSAASVARHVPKSSNAGGQGASKPDAPELFHRATSARASGRTDEAIGLLRQLLGQYPNSREARLSRLSLAKLLRSRGDAGAALAQFDAYLLTGGALAEEALVGRASCLQALHRPADEVAAWRTLLQRWPSSVHAERARLRLSELHADEP